MNNLNSICVQILFISSDQWIQWTLEDRQILLTSRVTLCIFCTSPNVNEMFDNKKMGAELQ